MPESANRSLSMLAAALEKEEFGRDVYAKAFRESKNDLGKDIFRTLLTEESIHITRIKRIYEALSAGSAWSSDWKSIGGVNEDLNELFKARIAALGTGIKPDTGDLEAVNIGMEFEQGAIKFYEDQLTQASEDLERTFIQAMIKEERTHYSTLSDIKLFLTDPESYYSELEHHGLDGA